MKKEAPLLVTIGGQQKKEKKRKGEREKDLTQECRNTSNFEQPSYVLVQLSLFSLWHLYIKRGQLQFGGGGGAYFYKAESLHISDVGKTTAIPKNTIKESFGR